MNKQINKNLKNSLACYSFRGHDFEVAASGGWVNGHNAAARVRWAKRFTSRANRRLSRAIARDVE